MSDPEDDDAPSQYASPPCFLHEVDPVYAGLAPAFDSRQHADVMRWRKGERARLIEERLALPVEQRRRLGEQIASGLEAAIGKVEGVTVSAYWPFRGEPDLRPLLGRIVARGGHCALPVVVERHHPLVFRAWAPGDKLEPGVWNIPVPADGAEVIPDVVIAPVVGFDKACYRLGYGGGFFDRTLAALPIRPRLFGVGYCQAAIRTIYPQPHDIPLDAVITEAGLIQRTA